MNQINDAANSRHDLQAILHNGRAVPNYLLESVRAQVERNLCNLIEFDRYELKHICGKEYWNPLSKGERRLAGQCMAHLVAADLVPLMDAPQRHEYPKRYQLK
jgi:hypothetical protein